MTQSQDVNDLNLIKYYLNVANTALVVNDNQSKLLSRKSILNALTSDTTVAFRVGKGETVSEEVFTTRFIDGQFTPVQKASRVESETDTAYVLQRTFLEDVMQRANEFIENPNKLDWGWVRETENGEG